jgi:drug/metabolite transporter superfamily protein YnfA
VTALFWYALAATGEIAGCSVFWAWLRLGQSAVWTLPGVASLIVFALALASHRCGCGRPRLCGVWRYLYSFIVVVAVDSRENTPGSLGRCWGLDLPCWSYHHFLWIASTLDVQRESRPTQPNSSHSQAEPSSDFARTTPKHSSSQASPEIALVTTALPKVCSSKVGAWLHSISASWRVGTWSTGYGDGFSKAFAL